MSNAAETLADRQAKGTSPDRGSDKVVERWLGGHRRLSAEDVQLLVDTARRFDGQLIGASGDSDDEFCGTMSFNHVKIGPLVDALTYSGWVLRIFPYGMPQIDRTIVQFGRQSFFR